MAFERMQARGKAEPVDMWEAGGATLHHASEIAAAAFANGALPI